MSGFGSRALAVALLVSSVANLASAEQFILENVRLAGGGTLSGTTTTDGTPSMVPTGDITATTDIPNDPGLDSTHSIDEGGDSTIAESLPNPYSQLTDGGAILRLIFSSPDPTASGATIKAGGHSRENEAGDTRKVIVGLVVPEPASIALTASALAIALASVRVRRGNSGTFHRRAN